MLFHKINSNSSNRCIKWITTIITIFKIDSNGAKYYIKRIIATIILLLIYIKKLNISTLVLKDFRLSSLEPLSKIDSLFSLEITDTYIADISSLKDFSGLLYLSLTNVSSDSQISLCENGNYKEIYLSNVEIDLDSLSHCTDLISLGLENIHPINGTDLELPGSLRQAAFKDCGLTDLNIVLSQPELTSLDVSCNTIQDIDGLKAFSNLEELSLAYNPVHDLSPIQHLKSIAALNLSGITLEKEELAMLSGMQLEELSASNCNISDLDFLEGHYEIKKLDLSDNLIDDIRMLEIYRQDLKYLNISENPIKDLTPLKEWVPKALFFGDYPELEGVELDVSGISLGKIEHERGIGVIQSMVLSKLTARNCSLENTEIALAQIKLQFLDVSENPIEEFICLDGLPFLKDIVARDSLISEKELPYLSIMLTPPGTYGISSLWKFFPINTIKREWIGLF